MNFRVLSNRAMISISAFLLANPDVRAVLQSDSLGRASLEYLGSAHYMLAGLHKRRQDNEDAITALNRRITGLDNTHDRRGRSLFYHLLALRDGTDDPRLIALCDRLLTICFPRGLAHLQAAYLDEAGWAESVQAAVSAEDLAALDALPIGPYTLGQLFREWIDAGITLGKCVHERAQCKAAAAANGHAAARINANKVRSLWIRTMRALLNNVELMPLTAEQQSLLLAPLGESVGKALRGPLGAPGADVDDVGADADAVADADTDADADADADTDTDADADADAGADADADTDADTDADASADADAASESASAS